MMKIYRSEECKEDEKKDEAEKPLLKDQYREDEDEPVFFDFSKEQSKILFPHGWQNFEK